MAHTYPKLPHPRLEAPDDWHAWKRIPRHLIVGGYPRDSRRALNNPDTDGPLNIGRREERFPPQNTGQVSEREAYNIFMSLNAAVQRKIRHHGVASAPIKIIKRQPPRGISISSPLLRMRGDTSHRLHNH